MPKILELLKTYHFALAISTSAILALALIFLENIEYLSRQFSEIHAWHLYLWGIIAIWNNLILKCHHSLTHSTLDLVLWDFVKNVLWSLDFLQELNLIDIVGVVNFVDLISSKNFKIKLYTYTVAHWYYKFHTLSSISPH